MRFAFGTSERFETLSGQPDTSPKLSDWLGPIGTAIIAPTIVIVGWAFAKPEQAMYAGITALGLGLLLFAMWFAHRREALGAHKILFYASFVPVLAGVAIIGATTYGSSASKIDSKAPISSGIGLSTTDLSASDAQDLIGSQRFGVFITRVELGSPVEKAGLLQGDIIQKVNRNVVTSRIDLDSQLDSIPRSGSIALSIWRGGRTKDVPISLP